MKDITQCFYYDGGCCTCIECYIEKCPVAVEQMSEDEKIFYGVKEGERHQG